MSLLGWILTVEREIVLRSVNLEDFKRRKQYEKLASRFIKEMSSLQLKNEKVFLHVILDFTDLIGKLL